MLGAMKTQPASLEIMPGRLLSLAGDAAGITQAALLITLAGGFLMPSIAAWSMLFYLTLMPAVLWRLWQGWRPDWRNPALAAMLALWLWSTLAICWDTNVSGHGNTHFYWLWNAGCTLIFLLGFLMAQTSAAAPQRIVAALLAGAAGNTALSVALFLAQGDLTTRLFGWGITRNPTLGAAIIEICLLLAIKSGMGGRRWAWAAAVPMGLYLLFSYSRAALIGLSVALAILGFGANLALSAAVCAAVLAVLGLVWRFWHGLFSVVWENLVGRGTDCHVLIWRTAWQQIARHPLIGFGPSARLPITASEYCPAYPSPHDLYLSLLYYSGGIGFGLFLLTLALLSRHLRRAVPGGAARRFWLALAVIPFIAGLSDLSQIIKGPAPTWYIVWLPMLLVLTLPTRKSQAEPEISV